MKSKSSLHRRLPQLIGVIHLPALAGSPGAYGVHPSAALARAGDRAVREAKALAHAGYDGLILENFGDVPFYASQVPPETVAQMSILAAAVCESVRIAIGINVLRNDARSALAIAAVTGCRFVRINVFTGVAATDQGLIEGDAAHWIRERDRLGADVAVLADVHVKHARSLSSDDIALSVEECARRAGADGVIVTGLTTGRPVDATDLDRAAQAARVARLPLWIGSGASERELPSLMKAAYGVIVGSAIRRSGQAGAELDLKRLKSFQKSFKKAAR